MTPIDTIVSIKSGDEYGGKYTGKLGIIKKFTDDRVGVEFAGLKNHTSKHGLFWFKKENVTPSLFDAPKRNDAIIPAALAKAFLNFTFGATRASLGVKQVIFSGPKTIVFWLCTYKLKEIGCDLEKWEKEVTNERPKKLGGLLRSDSLPGHDEP